jgi:hypothetical protein
VTLTHSIGGDWLEADLVVYHSSASFLCSCCPLSEVLLDLYERGVTDCVSQVVWHNGTINDSALMYTHNFLFPSPRPILLEYIPLLIYNMHLVSESCC